MRPYLNASTPLPEPPAPADAIDWRESGPLELLDFAVDAAVGARGVDALVRLVTAGTGELVLPRHALRLARTLTLTPTLTPTLTLTLTPRHALPLLPTLPLGSLANLSVRLDALNLSGLDRLSSMQLLQPVAGAHGQAAAPSSLASRLALERASLSLGLNLTVTPIQAALQAPPLTESFQVTLDVREASAAVLLLLAVNGSALRRLSAADLRPPACLLAPILEAGVRGLGVGLGGAQLRLRALQGALEADIDGVLNNASRLLLQAFAPLIPRAASGLVGGPLRDLSDELLRAALARLRPPPGRCAPRPPPPPPPPPPGSFAWNGSTLLALLDAAQARAGPAGLNGLVRVLTGGAGAAAVPAGALPALRRNVSGLGELVISVGDIGEI